LVHTPPVPSGSQRSPAVSSGTSFAQVADAILGKRACGLNPDKDEVQGDAGARLDLRAAGPLPHRPRSAGAGRPGTQLPWHGISVTASSTQAARSGSPRLKNEWVRPDREASRDPGHSLLTRERRPAWDHGSGGLKWAISRGEVPSPSTPSMSHSRLSWPLIPAGVPVMFRRSGASAPISKRSTEQTALLRATPAQREHTFDPSHGGSQGFKSPHLHPTPDDQRKRWSSSGSGPVQVAA
jgi:hypothetical protein